MLEAKSNCDLNTRIDSSFPYYLTLIQGKPPRDPKRRPMDLVHRAKIFAPLEGYSDYIAKINERFNDPEPDKTEPNICQFWEDP